MSIIDFPISLKLGRDKRPTGDAITLDGKDLAIIFLGVALVFTVLALLSFASHR